MTNLVVNGAGFNFTAQLTTPINYSQQSWGGNWISVYFNTQWFGQNLTYTTGSLLPSGGIITGISVTSTVTVQAYLSINDAYYTIVSSDIGINADLMALNIVSNSPTPVYIWGGSGNDLLAWYAGVSNSPTSINGGAGSDTLELGRNSDNYIFTKYNANTNTVSIHNIAANIDANLSSIESYKFTDKTLSFSNLTNIITGSQNNDTIQRTFAKDVIDGLSGVDTVIYTGSKSNYTILKSESTYTVTDKTGVDGADTLTNIERLQFSDKTVALDVNGTAGQAYRVYQAAFNRTPDNSGLKYWIGLMDGGVSLPTVSSAFIASAEFKALYGANPTNEVFISKLYDNVLHRAPDLGGYNYWVDFLKTNKIDSISTLINFSESAENQAGVIGVIKNGIDLLN